MPEELSLQINLTSGTDPEPVNTQSLSDRSGEHPLSQSSELIHISRTVPDPFGWFPYLKQDLTLIIHKRAAQIGGTGINADCIAGHDFAFPCGLN